MKNPRKHDLVIERTLNAPKELVFRAWTEPKLLARWWGPDGVTNPVCEVEPKPGGSIYIVMLAGKDLGEMEGQEWPMKGTFKEISPPDKIVYTSSAIEDKSGTPQLENVVTVLLEDLKGKTKMTLKIEVTKAGPGTEMPLKGMPIGWNQSIDKLARELEKKGFGKG